MARYTARLRTKPSSRIFTRSASKYTTAYTGSRGRFCQAPTSSSTASVTADTSAGDTSIPYRSSMCESDERRDHRPAHSCEH